jgi:hypothetical protein
MTSSEVGWRSGWSVWHCRVNSSITLNQFKLRPRSSRSKMKSQAQTWLGYSGRWRARTVVACPRTPALVLHLGHAVAFPLPEAIHTPSVHGEAFPAKKRSDAAISVAGMRAHER